MAVSKMKLRAGPSKPRQRKGPGRPPKVMQSHEVEQVPWKLRLNELLVSRGISMREASIMAGLNPTTVRSMLVTPRSVGIDVLSAICDALDISVEWLVRGAGDAARDVHKASIVSVPVIRWSEIEEHLTSKQDIEAMRYLPTTRVEPSEKRFALEFSGSSMAPAIQDRDEIDCLPNARANPDDIVVAYIRSLGEYVCRRVRSPEVNRNGVIISGTLEAIGTGWSKIEFEHSKGDRIVAVVVGVHRTLRRLQ